MSGARRIGRYLLCDELAAGGTAVVHLGRLLGPVGFARTVAIKRLLPHLSRDPDARAMIVDEARLATRIHHPNVVSVLDVVADDHELLLVLEYVHGESLSRLQRAAQKHAEKIPIEVTAAIVAGVLHGLHAAHTARDENGTPLEMVHRDVSPQNVLVGADGIARLLDFGIAKAVSRVQVTREGVVKGKFAYMAPEQISPHVGRRDVPAVDRRTDVYAAGIVLWELLTGRRLFHAEGEGELIAKILEPRVEPPSTFVRAAAPLDEVVMRALAIEPGARFESAREMAIAIEEALPPATATRVAAWVQSLIAETLVERADLVSRAERAEASEELVTAVAPPRPRRWPYAAGLLLVLSAAAFAWSRRSETPKVAPVAPIAPGSTSAAVVSAAPSASPSAAPGAMSSAAVSGSALKTAKPVPIAKPSVTKGPNPCDPPYDIDASGRKIYKAACL